MTKIKIEGGSSPEEIAKALEEMKKNARPRIGAAVLVEDMNDPTVARLLLGRRAKEPNLGKWVIPGGGVKFGEPWREAARREILEETGLMIALSDENPRVHEIISENEHRIIMYARGWPTGGRLRASSDLSEVRFFSRRELRGEDFDDELSPAILPILHVFGWT